LRKIFRLTSLAVPRFRSGAPFLRRVRELLPELSAPPHVVPTAAPLEVAVRRVPGRRSARTMEQRAGGTRPGDGVRHSRRTQGVHERLLSGTCETTKHRHRGEVPGLQGTTRVLCRPLQSREHELGSRRLDSAYGNDKIHYNYVISAFQKFPFQFVLHQYTDLACELYRSQLLVVSIYLCHLSLFVLIMEAVSPSETSVSMYQTARHSIPEDSHLRRLHSLWSRYKN
jgi:hypothetical protein